MPEQTIGHTSPYETAPVVSAVIVIGVAALMIMGIQPILLGGLVESHRLTEVSMGYAAAIELFGIALGAGLGPLLVNRNMRLKVFAASIALAGVQGSIYIAGSPLVIVAERGVAGALEGVLLGAASLIAVHNSRPERMNGLFIGLATAPQVLAAYALPMFILPRYGLNAGFLVLCATALFSAVGSLFIVDRVEARHAEAHGRIAWTPALIGVVAAVFLQNAGCTAAWSYTEQLAHQHLISGQAVGLAAAVCLTLQVVAALLVAWLGRHIPTWPAMIMAAFLQAILLCAITFADTPWRYSLLLCGFGVFGLAQQPLQVAEIVALDPTRRVATFVPATALTGISAGPFAVSFLVSAGHADRAFWGAAAMLAVCGAVLAVAAFTRRHGVASRLQTPRDLIAPSGGRPKAV